MCIHVYHSEAYTGLTVGGRLRSQPSGRVPDPSFSMAGRGSRWEPDCATRRAVPFMVRTLRHRNMYPGRETKHNQATPSTIRHAQEAEWRGRAGLGVPTRRLPGGPPDNWGTGPGPPQRDWDSVPLTYGNAMSVGPLARRSAYCHVVRSLGRVIPHGQSRTWRGSERW